MKIAIAAVVGDTKPSSDLIKKVALWTRIYDLPLNDHNEETLIAIASKLGELIRYEVPDLLNLNTYIRFKIAVDLDKPLKKDFKLTLNGNILTLSIKYERLPNYCFGCGGLGHHLQRCATYDLEGGMEFADLPFGAQLKAQALRRTSGSSFVVKEYV